MNYPCKHGVTRFCAFCENPPEQTSNPSKGDELKPCPFCGGKAYIGYELGMMYCHYFAKCQSCYALIPTNSPNEIDATNKWNTRV